MKKVQITIIILVAILAIACITFAAVYFATDTFKSDKDLFYKYAKQIDLKEFVDLESYNAYSKRLQTEGHASEGEFSIQMTEEEQRISESIKYNGYTDPINKTENYDISINKDGEELIAVNYLKDQDLYGILFKDIVNQYIVVENNNLKEFASKLGVKDTSKIPDRIEIPETNVNYEEINSILNKYLNTAIETIPKDNYSKIKKGNIALDDKTVEADGYQVKLKVKDVQTILTKVLESAKNDEQVFNLMKKFNSEEITFEDYQASIDGNLEEISREISNEENIDIVYITVYKQGKDTVKLLIEIGVEEPKNKMELSIEESGNSISLVYDYFITTRSRTRENKMIITKTATSEEQETIEGVITQIEDGEEQYNSKVMVARNGAYGSNNISFNISMALTMPLLSENASVIISINNISDFSGVPLEGEFRQDNHLVINGVSPEQLSNLFTNLGAKISDKLKDEMFVSIIRNIVTVNDGLYQMSEQAVQNTQNAIEEERALTEQMQGNFDQMPTINPLTVDTEPRE